MRGIDKKRAMTAGATLCIAAAAGYFMQTGTPLPGGNRAAPIPQPVIASATPGLITPVVPETAEVTRADNDPILPFAAPQSAEPLRLAALEPDIMPDILPETVEVSDDTGEMACDVGFTATASPGALVALTLEAPCYAGQVVEFFHAGMRFNEELDDAGLVLVRVPALEEDATFAASFADGNTVGTDILMPTLSRFERAALVWQGDTGLGLHALENGASYGEDGHISANAPGNPERATSTEGGFITVLGSVPGGWAVDIYTYPKVMIGAGPDPEVSVEAEVLQVTCNLPVRGTYLRATPTGAPVESDLSFGAAGCDAVGEFLVLKNLPQDLKIAHN